MKLPVNIGLSSSALCCRLAPFSQVKSAKANGSVGFSSAGSAGKGDAGGAGVAAGGGAGAMGGGGGATMGAGAGGVTAGGGGARGSGAACADEKPSNRTKHMPAAAQAPRQRNDINRSIDSSSFGHELDTDLPRRPSEPGRKLPRRPEQPPTSSARHALDLTAVQAAGSTVVEPHGVPPSRSPPGPLRHSANHSLCTTAVSFAVSRRPNVDAAIYKCRK